MRIPLPSPEAIFLSITLALVAALASWFEYPLSLNNITHDRFQRAYTGEIPDDIIIIGIDEASLQGIGKWPWRRDIHAKLINRLTEAGVRAVAYDIIFAERDTPNPRYDAALVKAVKRNAKVVLPIYIGETKQGGQLVEVFPFDELNNVAAKLAHVHIEIDKDGVLRSTHLKEGLGTTYWKHFSVALYEIAYGESLDPLPGARANLPDNAGMMIVRDYRNQIRFTAGPGELRVVSFIDALDGRFPAQNFKDKIVFIGTMAAGLSDTLATPVSSANRHMQGVELNANIFHALRNGSLIRPVSSVQGAMITGMLVFIAILFLTTILPSASLIATIVLSLASVFASYFALQFHDIWWPPAAALLAIGASYPLWSWRRLDRSMRYLREELNILDSDVNLLAEKPPLSQASSTMHLLERWLPMKQWKASVISPEPSRKHTKWQHQLGTSNAIVQDEDQAIALEIEWPSQSAPNASEQELLEDLLKPWRAQAIKLPRGNVDIVAYHIAQIKRNHANRRELRHFIFSCLANLLDGVVATSLSGRIILINNQARSLLKLPEEAPLTETFVSLLEKHTDDDDTTLGKTLDSVYRERKSVQQEISINNGTEILLQGNEFDLEDEDNKVIIFTLTDITRIREMERTRAETLSFVSHDLRSPLVSILALIDGKHSNETDARPTSPEFIDIRRYAHRALSYTESFLQLARAEADNIALYECDLHAIVDNAAENIYTLAANKKIRITTEHCEEEIWVWGNGDLLERMIINLLDNAIKYSDSGGIVSVELSSDKHRPNTAKISVIDQGIGIPEDDMPHLF